MNELEVIVEKNKQTPRQHDKRNHEKNQTQKETRPLLGNQIVEPKSWIGRKNFPTNHLIALNLKWFIS